MRLKKPPDREAFCSYLFFDIFQYARIFSKTVIKRIILDSSSIAFAVSRMAEISFIETL